MRLIVLIRNYLLPIIFTSRCLILLYLFMLFSAVFVIIYRHYTIIDFNEVDIRIYLPEKVIFTEAACVHSNKGKWKKKY